MIAYTGPIVPPPPTPLTARATARSAYNALSSRSAYNALSPRPEGRWDALSTAEQQRYVDFTRRVRDLSPHVGNTSAKLLPEEIRVGDSLYVVVEGDGRIVTRSGVVGYIERHAASGRVHSAWTGYPSKGGTSVLYGPIEGSSATIYLLDRPAPELAAGTVLMGIKLDGRDYDLGVVLPGNEVRLLQHGNVLARRVLVTDLDAYTLAEVVAK